MNSTKDIGTYMWETDDYALLAMLCESPLTLITSNNNAAVVWCLCLGCGDWWLPSQQQSQSHLCSCCNPHMTSLKEKYIQLYFVFDAHEVLYFNSNLRQCMWQIDAFIFDREILKFHSTGLWSYTVCWLGMYRQR